MNAKELTEVVAKNHKGLPKSQVHKIVTDTFHTIQMAVKKGNEVRLVGFGTFVKAKRKARIGRNPQSGEAIKIPATNFPKFRPGSEFKSAVK